AAASRSRKISRSVRIYLRTSVSLAFNSANRFPSKVSMFQTSIRLTAMLGFFAQSAPELELLSLPFRVVRQHRQLLQALVELRGRFRHRRAGGRSPTGLAPTDTGASSTNSWATGSWYYLARRSTIPPPEAVLVEKPSSAGQTVRVCF